MTRKANSARDDASTRRNWGALVFALLLAAAVLFFAWTVITGARRTTDWLLIAPGALIAAAAFIWAGITDLSSRRRVGPIVAAARDEAARPLILIALTCAFAIAAPFVGFDVSTAIFILLCLLVQGERAWWKLILVAGGGATLMTWIFTELLTVRLPVLLF